MGSGLLSAEASTLLIIDMQGRLVPVLSEAEALVARVSLLAQAAALLDVPVRATEHHARALGTTVAPLAQPSRAIFRKMHFNAVGEPGFLAWLPSARAGIVIAGAEAHICVLQTAIGLAHSGYRVSVVADAVGSRQPRDREAALARLAANGVEVLTAEMVIFEWMGRADHTRFREVLQLVK